MASPSFEGRLVDDLFADDLFADDRRAGDFSYWSHEKGGDPAGLIFWVPDPGDKSKLLLMGVNFTKWTWDGNRAAPTISPSICKIDGDKWHGYLEAGNFRGV